MSQTASKFIPSTPTIPIAVTSQVDPKSRPNSVMLFVSISINPTPSQNGLQFTKNLPLSEKTALEPSAASPIRKSSAVTWYGLGMRLFKKRNGQSSVGTRSSEIGAKEVSRV